MPYPKKLPQQMYSEVVEYERQLRAADGTIVSEGTPEAEAAQAVYDIVISTETPVRRPWGMETLSHTSSAVDMSLAKRGLSFLLEHGGAFAPMQVDPDMHVGVVENVRLDGAKLRGQVRFSPTPRGQQAEAEFRAKTRPYISVSWVPVGTKFVKQTRAAKNPGELDEYLITRWRPMEVSSVSVPADVNARVGRSVGKPEDEYPVEVEGIEPDREEQDMAKKVKDGANVIEVADDDPRAAIEAAPQSRSDGRDLVAEERTRVSEIMRLCRERGVPQERAAHFIDNGFSVRDAKATLFEEMQSRSTPAQPPAEQIVPLKPKDAGRYSILRALRMAVEVREGRAAKIDGLEGEVHAEIEKNAVAAGLQTRGGVFVPLRQYEGPMDRQMRAVSMGPDVPGAGAELVQHIQGELIDLLRNRMVLSFLGARTLPGLVGTITWPRVKTDPTVQWMGTNPGTAATDSGMTYGWVVSTAKTMIGTVPFPRQLLSATGIDVEADIRNRLAIGHALALDLAGIKGLGTDREPLGVLNNADCQTYDIGTSGSPAVPSYIKLKRMTGLVSKKNVTGGSMGFLTTALMAAELGGTQVATNMPRFIWEGNNEDGVVAGYKAAASSQVPENLYTSGTDHGLIFGAWDNLVIGLWSGGLELLVDPYSLATYGQIRVTSYSQGDIVNQRPDAFVIGRYAKISA